MKNKINVGTTSLLCRVVIYDSTAAYPKPLTGLVYNSSGLTCYYIRAGSASATAVTLATATVGTFTSGGFKEVDSTNMPGVYEIGIPNAALASGATSVVMVLKGGTNMVQVSLEIELDLINYQDGVRAGLTAIPNVNFGTTGGLLGYGTGTGQVSPTSGNVSLITSQNPSVQNGTAQAGAASTITLAAGALATDSIYVGSVITIQSGTGVGQSRVITGYVGSTKVATVNSAWQTNPDATSVYSVFGEFVPTADSSLRVTVGSNADKTGYSLTQAFPANFSSLAINGSGYVTVVTNNDKTGYSLTQTFPTNFSSLAITGGGAVTAGTVSDKTGYALTAGEHTSIASDAQTGLTAQGYTTTRAGYLDTLNGLVAAIWAYATRTLTAAVTVTGTVAANITQVLSTALTETTGGNLAGAFKKFFDVATPTLTVAGKDQTGDSYARLGAPAGASVSADVATVQTTVNSHTDSAVSGLATLSQLATDLTAITTAITAAQTAINAHTDTDTAVLATSTALAAAKAEIDAIKAKTDALPTDPASQLITNNMIIAMSE